MEDFNKNNKISNRSDEEGLSNHLFNYKNKFTPIQKTSIKSIRNTDNNTFINNSSITTKARRILLRKGSNGLGFNIVGGEDGSGIFVSFILAGGQADLSGELRTGDKLISVNGLDFQNITHREAVSILKSTGNEKNLDVIELIVKYTPDEYDRFSLKVDMLREQLINTSSLMEVGRVGQLKTTHKRTLYIRCLFDYNPAIDSGLPSRGLPFRHGYILHVINASDEEWWQAKVLIPPPNDVEYFGIIPSKQRVERRERARLKNVKFHQLNMPSSSTSSLSSASEKRLKFNIVFSRKFPFMKSKEKSGSDGALSCCDDDENILSYEPVIQQKIDYTRPVIILGLFKDKLNDELLTEFPEKFSSCIPYTSRCIRDDEEEGKDYYFRSRKEMERDIDDHLFIEAGQYNGNLYGTSISAVRKIARLGQHCILDVSANAIKRLRIANLNPISILVKAQSPESLMQSNELMNFDEAHHHYNKSIELENVFAEYFTAIINGSLFDDIFLAIKQIIRDQSGPVIWLQSKEKL